MTNPLLIAVSCEHLMLTFEEYHSDLKIDISRFLEKVLKFTRVGRAVMGKDEGISPDFVREDLVVSAGWDNWSGDYLLSNSAAGDALFQDIFGAIEPNSTFNSDALKREG